MEFSLGGMFGDMGVGAVVGFITGFALKKIMKLAMAIIGAYLLSLLWLQQKGVIEINQDKLFNLATGWSSAVMSIGEKAVGILPGTTAFMAGFYVGFRKG
ncbi:MAG: hypothetical protein J7L37_08390 [Thermococcus sp.]|nr:hypothetical protein [Thermococcus sp.]